MRERHSSREGMTWLEMDVLDLKLEEEFDLVIDKGAMVQGLHMALLNEADLSGTMEYARLAD
jgi:hypothetical protein